MRQAQFENVCTAHNRPACCPQYSRPSSTETARLGSRTSSFSSHTKPERDPRPLPLRYSSPQRSSYLQSGESSAAMSQLYSMPYAGPRPFEKGFLVKVISPARALNLISAYSIPPYACRLIVHVTINTQWVGSRARSWYGAFVIVVAKLRRANRWMSRKHLTFDPMNLSEQKNIDLIGWILERVLASFPKCVFKLIQSKINI